MKASRRRKAEKYCVTPAGTSNELDVQNEWEENTHTHRHNATGEEFSFNQSARHRTHFLADTSNRAWTANNIVFLIIDDLVKQQLHLEARSCFVLHSCGVNLTYYMKLNNSSEKTYTSK